MSATTYAVLAALMVCGSLAERITNVESPSWSRRTPAPGDSDYGFDSRSTGRDRSPSFEGDDVNVRPSWGSATDSPRRFTHTWERSDAPATRSSYLDRFTTQRPYGSGSGSDYDRDTSYGAYSSRRPSYQTDHWGDPIGGERTTPRSPYESVRDRDTTDRWGSSSGRDRTSAWGLGSRTTSRWDRTDDFDSGSGLGSGRRDSFDPNNAYVRIQAELVKLTNDKGLTSTGGKCDTFGACDTVCYGYLDTDRPNAEFPGSRDSKYWPKLFETDDNNSPFFTRANITRDVCGSPYREATFRVLCEDRDSINSNDLINKWDCNIQRSPEGETFATWHSADCTPKFQADKMRLTFRYKIHTVPRSRCDPSTGSIVVAGGTTPKTTKRRS